VNLNKSTRYALHAAVDLALAGDAPVTTAQIAARYGIPENVLSKVLQQLVRSGIAQASRGVGGGYRLARPATTVTVQDVIDLFEPAPAPVSDSAAARDAGAAGRLRGLFDEVDETVRATFASVTLATLAS